MIFFLKYPEGIPTKLIGNYEGEIKVLNTYKNELNISTIDISHLPNGIYLIEIQVSEIEHFVKKIVKI